MVAEARRGEEVRRDGWVIQEDSDEEDERSSVAEAQGAAPASRFEMAGRGRRELT